MSLCFLVEGDRTEKRMYRAWVGHVFPSLTHVLTIGEITSSSYCVISGGGIPLYKEELRDALSDIRQNAQVRHLFLCIDAEELSREERRREMEDEIRKAEIESRVRTGNPWLAIHPIVQNCCVETWFLGHAKMMRRNPSSELLREFKAFYDVSERDPERMAAYRGFRTRAEFHLHYLKEMLREQNPMLSYTKKRPDAVLGADYLRALRHRCVATGHLASLQELFDTWESIAPHAASP